MNQRIPWQCLYAHIFEISEEQAEYGTHIVRYPFAIQIGLPDGPEIWDRELGNLTTQGDTPNEAICAMVKVLTLMDYRGGIEVWGEEHAHFGYIDFEPEKPKIRLNWTEISLMYGFSPADPDTKGAPC